MHLLIKIIKYITLCHVAYMSREKMNWLFRMIYQAVSSSFSTKPVTMSDVVHIAIQRITISEGINNGIAREHAYSTTNHATERKFKKNSKHVSQPYLSIMLKHTMNTA